MDKSEKHMDMNNFIRENLMGEGSAWTENGAASYGSMGSELLNQFGKAGAYRLRPWKAVWNDQAGLWNENEEQALVFPFYLRLITRKVTMSGDKKTEKVQRGQGAKDEAFKRLLWIACFHPESFYENLWIVPLVGSWKDMWVLMAMAKSSDVPVEFELDENKFFDVIAAGINDSYHKNLVKKYMPRIRSEKKCSTDWACESNRLAKAFANRAGWSFKDYREFKATGKAHEFQQIICAGLYDNIKWNQIPGKALLNLISGPSNFLVKHRVLDNYMEWLDKQPVVKFNGYPFELGAKVHDYHPNLATIMTVNKQFDNLIQTGLSDDAAIKGNVLCALDTSGSMTCSVAPNTPVTAYDVCVSLGIYFSELNKGAFHNVVAMFDDNSELYTFKTKTFYDKLKELRERRDAMGGTNFQSLIDLIVDTRKNHPEIPVEDYPETLLVVSDMQFNPTSDGSWRSYRYESRSEDLPRDTITNYAKAMSKLSEVFPEEFVSNFKIVWWMCTGRPTDDFPSTMDHAGTYMFSGFDGAVISTLLSGKTDEQSGAVEKKSMEQIIREAFGQELLSQVVLA